MNRVRTIALIAGFGFIALAVLLQALLPAMMKETHEVDVHRVVRTSLGELKEVRAEARPYSELNTMGRNIYIREGCWYCHSMYIRPVAGEDQRWGPVSEVGEYAYDTPHTFGTRRIGPDLLRVGEKYGDDWQRAHFFDPRLVVPDSIMPRFPWLFEEEGNIARPTLEGEALISFVQSLGMQRGKWRDLFMYQIQVSGSSSMSSQESIENGRKSYKRRCIGCHGENGDGKGRAAVFFTKAKPRDFTSGTYKFRTTPSGSLPLDSDIYRTISLGMRGTAMPPWFGLSEAERWDLVHFIKTFSKEFKKAIPEPPLYIPPAPVPDKAMIAHGEKLFRTFQCGVCHGKEGHGDGPAAAALTDDWGNKIVPTDFTKGQFKGGPRAEDIYRTVMTGLNGTPMPSFASILTNEGDRWAIAFFILSMSKDEQ